MTTTISTRIAFTRETRIDASYLDAQFSLAGYVMYIRQEKRGP